MILSNVVCWGVIISSGLSVFIIIKILIERSEKNLWELTYGVLSTDLVWSLPRLGLNISGIYRGRWGYVWGRSCLFYPVSKTMLESDPSSASYTLTIRSKSCTFRRDPGLLEQNNFLLFSSGKVHAVFREKPSYVRSGLLSIQFLIRCNAAIDVLLSFDESNRLRCRVMRDAKANKEVVAYIRMDWSSGRFM